MGHAAETGVNAARLASLGYDGPATALEGERGFFASFGGGHDPSRILGRLGAPWAIVDPGTSIKPYPSGVVGHPGMDAMVELVRDHDLRPHEVERIEVLTGPNVVKPGPLRIAHAHNALEGKFCVAFQMAAIVLRGKAGLAEFRDEFVASEACQEMQRRVDVSIAPAYRRHGEGPRGLRARRHYDRRPPSRRPPRRRTTAAGRAIRSAGTISRESSGTAPTACSTRTGSRRSSLWWTGWRSSRPCAT